jgi:Protein of unknown function (DUF3179)
MAQGDLDLPGFPPEPPQARRRPIWAQGLACVAILPLVGFIGGKGWALWDEWRGLRGDEVSARANSVIGYVNITPNPSYADPPAKWLHDDGDQTVLWAGYRNDVHQWFRFGRGELDTRQLSMPIGRDTIRAIDRPIFEQRGGERWGRIPDEAPVVGLEGGDEPPVYPIRVLDKVVAINDRVEKRPILVVFTPIKEEVAIFESGVGGRPVMMGQSGYFVGYSPLLYDRETESLWLESGEAMTAVAGARKGTRLSRIARVVPGSWGEWKARHPRTRLVVGADRSTAGPAGPAPLAP